MLWSISGTSAQAFTPEARKKIPSQLLHVSLVISTSDTHSRIWVDRYSCNSYFLTLWPQGERLLFSYTLATVGTSTGDIFYLEWYCFSTGFVLITPFFEEHHHVVKTTLGYISLHMGGLRLAYFHSVVRNKRSSLNTVISSLSPCFLTPVLFIA